MAAFVGRKVELAALEGALAEARAGRGRLFFLVGEPGIGKTRLADELCARAASAARVLWGRCWEAGGAPAFWPWIEIMRPLVAEGDPVALATDLGADAALVAALLPELRHRLPGLPTEPPSRSESARFLLFDAVARFLRARSLATPLVLILDDLHAADEPSLRLLEFIARGLRGARLLIVGSYREADARLLPETARLLSTIERDGHRFPLRRLQSDEVRELIASSSGVTPTADVVDAVVRVTEGTPLFVNEVLSAVVAQGTRAISTPAGKIVVPDGLGPAIRGRLARVSDETRAVLQVASVIGRDFGLPLLGAVTGAPGADLGERLSEAERTGLVLDLHADPPRFRFSHILVRETIYDDLGAAGRERIHLQVAQALAASAERSLDPAITLAEIAHHYLRAGPPGRASSADYARRAGHHALDLCAHEQARAHFQAALGALSDEGPEADRSRAELWLKLADAELRGGARAHSCHASEQAADVARRLGDHELFARAALSRGAEFTFGQTEPRLVALLEEALAALGDEPTGLRARLLARLAAAQQPAANPEEPISAAQRAISMARETGDRATLAMVVRDARAAYLPMDSLEQKLALDLEALSLAYEAGDRLAAIHAQRRLGGDRLEEGEIAAALGHVEQYERLADEMREPHRKWWSDAMRATVFTLRGEFAASERLLGQAEALGDSDPLARDLLGARRLELIWTARRDADLKVADAALARQYAERAIPEISLFRMVVRARMGDRDFLANALKAFPHRVMHPRMGGKNFVAEFAVLLGDRTMAAAQYELLLPWSRRFMAHFGFEGSYARLLGMLAELLGKPDDARRHFEDAIARNESIGSTPWVAHTLVAYSAMLSRTGDERDRRRSADLMQRAMGIARELGMPGILALGGEAIGDATEAHAVSQPPGDPAFSFRLEGEYWTVTFGGQSFRFRDNKGLQLVDYLLSHPDREFHVLHLAGVTEGNGSAQLIESSLASGPDASARAAYKTRLADLEDQLEEAEANADVGRAERARREIDLLTEEVTRGLGLGGRERGSGGSAERARVNVQRRISDALKKIEAACPPLGRQLARAIRTGTYCSYSRA